MNVKEAMRVESLAGELTTILSDGDWPEDQRNMAYALKDAMMALASMMRAHLDQATVEDIREALEAAHWASLSEAQKDEAIRKAMH